MSGIIGSRLNVRGSGLVSKLGTDGQVLTSAGAGIQSAFEDVAGGVSWQAVETGSTMTAVAGNGYPIDTTSNACTITLPASASNGDQIVFTDYARNWGTNAITIDSNGLNYQGDDDTFTVEYTTDGQSVNIVYSGSTNGWIPIEDDTVTDAPINPIYCPTGIFGGGENGGKVGVTNLVTSAGVVGSDVAAVMTARGYIMACEFGQDKGIFGFGNDGDYTGVTNLVSNVGVVASDVAAVGTAREGPGSATYGGDKGIFPYGRTGSYLDISNLVSNAGVVASDTTSINGTTRSSSVGVEYGDNKDKALIFGGFYSGPTRTGVTNLISNAGVVATDTAAVATARGWAGACQYGYTKAIIGFGHTGSNVSMTNLISDVGVVASDTAGVGTARHGPAGCEYNYDKGIMAYGNSGSQTTLTNLVSNTGIMASDGAGAGTARQNLGGCSYG
jgi:hypothetical protein